MNPVVLASWDLLGKLTEGVQASDELDGEVHPHVLPHLEEAFNALRRVGFIHDIAAQREPN